MSLRTQSIFSRKSLGRVSLLAGCILFCLLLFTTSAISLHAQPAKQNPVGIAWQVRGSWQTQGLAEPILTGDAIQPGSLLLPGQGGTNHSITVLLPDGQRILYECFTSEDCAHGFRVPSLYRKPDPLGVEMLVRIQAVLGNERHDSSTVSKGQYTSRLPRDEAVAVLGSGNRVHIEGLVQSLPNGRYTYDLQPLDHAYPQQSHLVFDKTAPSVELALPASGLYAMTIADALNTPRIDLFIAAVKPAQEASVSKPFRELKALMSEWNEDYQGWPIHDFQRAYLKSLMSGEKQVPTAMNANAGVKSSSSAATPAGIIPKERVDATAEPSFSPNPGLFDADTEVTLQCSTQNAIIRYTVDGSQPTSSSPIYRAPIMVKGTALTIKAFAGGSGLRDSAVVTGIFRIE